MKILLVAATLGTILAQEPAPAPDIQEIMSRVADNQAAAQAQRKNWIYEQKQVLRMLRGDGKLAREEHRHYVITPKVDQTQKELAHFEGTYQSHGKVVAYDKPGYAYKGIDIDGLVINGLSEDMTNDKGSRDGIEHDLFPLVRKEQKKYDFQLKGQETYHGREVFRVSFTPKPHPEEGDGGDWKGEALIDTEDFQPVHVSTSLAYKIPMAVRILLGTNVRGLGFSLTYQRFADGVWFPVSYGGEFQVRAAFFYKRTISVAMTNSDFRRADVTSHIAYSVQDK